MGVYLRGFGGADHAPLGVVQLSRSSELAVAPHRRVEPTQVGERRRERQPVEHLVANGRTACKTRLADELTD